MKLTLSGQILTGIVGFCGVAILTLSASVAPANATQMTSILKTEQTITTKADDFYNQGVNKYSQGDLEGAIAAFSAAIKLDPDDVISYVNRGYTRYDLGDKKEQYKISAPQLASTLVMLLLMLIADIAAMTWEIAKEPSKITIQRSLLIIAIPLPTTIEFSS